MTEGRLHQDEATLTAIKRLCRAIIHDINNPLSAVSGYLQLSEMRLAKLQDGDYSVIEALVEAYYRPRDLPVAAEVVRPVGGSGFLIPQ